VTPVFLPNAAALLIIQATAYMMTLGRVERGDPVASACAYATVLFVLGMEGRLADLADASHDVIGVSLEDERLPKRIRLPRDRDKKKAVE
jgi:hypothetical protein